MISTLLDLPTNLCILKAVTVTSDECFCLINEWTGWMDGCKTLHPTTPTHTHLPLFLKGLQGLYFTRHTGQKTILILSTELKRPYFPL